MYSLGSPKTLTEFLYQRLCLSFFCDVGEQLPAKHISRSLAPLFVLNSVLNKSLCLETVHFEHLLWTSKSEVCGLTS